MLYALTHWHPNPNWYPEISGMSWGAKISDFGPLWGGSDPNPLLDVYLVYLKLWFFGEDQKCCWGCKMKNKPNFFLITGVFQTGGHSGRKSRFLAPLDIPDISGYQLGYGCQCVKAYSNENPVTHQKIL